jgi:DNA polymerase-3 subunit gamma/tau
MPYEVLARKWRPQQFDDVVGQEHVTRTLKNAIQTGRIAHAYLFVGPRGIGKTSVARILAKALNCKDGPTITPCGNCDSCKEIAAGTSLDVMEIDGASNNGVEQVRDLRETVKYAPTRGKYKIYIIDEVHMLSQAAFNALLKTLEEPPPHVKFIFATTEAEKILPTIVSRCQRFDLRRIPVAQIVERLRVIAQEEKVKVDEDALLAIARGSEGGLRDAESALDQLVSFKGSEISEEDVLSVFGLVARRTLEELGEKILKGDIKSLIKLVATLDASGKDLQRLVLELMDHFRNLLVCLNVDNIGEGLDLTETQVAVLKQQAQLTQTGRLLRVTEILADVEDRMRYTLSKRILLETALIRCARASVVVSLEEILAQINEIRGQESGGSGQPASLGSSAAPRASDEGLGPVAMVKEQKLDMAMEAGGDELKMLIQRWKEISEKVGKIAVATRSVLPDVRPVRVEKDRVVLAFDPEFADESERFHDLRMRKALEHVLGTMLKRDVSVDVTVAKSDAGEAGQAFEPVPPAPADTTTKGKNGKTRQDLLNDPAVQKAMDVFGGTIVDVRE